MTSKVKFKSLREDAAQGKKVKEKLGKQQCRGTCLGRKLIAMALLHAPKLGFESASNSRALFTASFLADIGVLDLSQVPNSTPCATSMKNIIFEAAADSILTEKKSMQELPLSILADKGDWRGSRDGTNFVKLISKISHERDEVDIMCIGISSAGNDSKSAAENISYILEGYDSENKKIIILNQGSDTGGGGTGKELTNEMEKTGRVRDIMEYNWTTCALYALNLTLSSPTKLTMGPGDLGRRTTLQLLHSVYNLSQSFRELNDHLYGNS